MLEQAQDLAARDILYLTNAVAVAKVATDR